MPYAPRKTDSHHSRSARPQQAGSSPSPPAAAESPRLSPMDVLGRFPAARAAIDDLLQDLSHLETPAERLAWVLGQENLSELSKLVGKDRSTLANYRLQRRQPDLGTLAAICRATGTSADWLLGLKEEPWAR